MDEDDGDREIIDMDDLSEEDKISIKEKMNRFVNPDDFSKYQRTPRCDQAFM